MVINIKIEDKNDEVCIINWLPNRDDFWVFGTAFYKDYYVIHEPQLS